MYTSKVDAWICKEREELSKGMLPDEHITDDITTADNMLDMYRHCDNPMNHYEQELDSAFMLSIMTKRLNLTLLLSKLTGRMDQDIILLLK